MLCQLPPENLSDTGYLTAGCNKYDQLQYVLTLEDRSKAKSPRPEQ